MKRAHSVGVNCIRNQRNRVNMGMKLPIDHGQWTNYRYRGKIKGHHHIVESCQ